MTRIRNEVDSLKRKANPDDDSDETLRLLLDIIGRRDALFYPWRYVATEDIEALRNYPAIKARQADYLAGNRGVEAKAVGQGEWKTLHYARKKLIDAGLVTATYSKGQVTSLFPTESGDAAAREMRKLPELIESYLYLEYLQRNPGLCFIDGPWLSESKLFRRELHGKPSEWAGLTERMLPLLVRGLVRSHFDTHGRVFYGFLSAEIPTPVVSNEPFRPWALDHYIEAYNAERDMLANLEYDGHEVTIPFPSNSFGNCFCSTEQGPQLGPGELVEILAGRMKLPTAKDNNHAENP